MSAKSFVASIASPVRCGWRHLRWCHLRWCHLRWRHLRWSFGAAAVLTLWACVNHTLVAPIGGTTQTSENQFQQSINRDLDILFMVDNSSSMTPLQVKMAAQLPTFMNVLKSLPTGQPNLHVAVITSSLGAGVFSDVPGCAPGTPGNNGGMFQHQSSCAGLDPTQHFLSSVADPANRGSFINNFTIPDISTVFSCIALVGQNGCGFEHQFASTWTALLKAEDPNDPDNANPGEPFLRPDAFLAIVMLTNEDDSSTPMTLNSTLYDPGVYSISDPSGLGGLQSYRQNEYGHLCDPASSPPPHLPPATPITLTGCTSSEGMSPSVRVSGVSPNLVVNYGPPDPLHQEIRVQDFVSFVKSLKTDPSKIFVAALAGPVTPYTVGSATFQLPDGTTELQPTMIHSCMQTSGEFADPAVRIKQFLDQFGVNGFFETICAPDFAPAMTAIATAIGKNLGAECIQGSVEAKTDGSGDPNCLVTFTTFNAANVPTVTPAPFCSETTLAKASMSDPCWHFVADAMGCPSANQIPNQRFELCYDPMCTAGSRPVSTANAAVSCALCPSGTKNPATGVVCP